VVNIKARGQFMKEMDIDLREECFSRWQLWVTCSEVGFQMLHILANIKNNK
jgi:hypothetical protein